MAENSQILTDLTSSNIDAKKKAILQAGDERIKGAVPILIKLLGSDPDSVVRNSAARALGKIADPAQKEAVLNALCQATSDPDYYTKVNACWSLGKLKDPRAVPCLTKMINPGQVIYMTTGDGKTDTAQKAVSAELKETGVQYSDSIVKAINALAEIGDPSGNPALHDALKDEQDGTVRCAAALALGKIKSTDSLDHLINALNDKYWYVRRDAAKALKDFKSPKAIKPLVRLLNDMYDQVKKNAMDALVATGKPAAKELFAIFITQPSNPALQQFFKGFSKPDMIALLDELIQTEPNAAKKEIYMKFLAQLK